MTRLCPGSGSRGSWARRSLSVLLGAALVAGALVAATPSASALVPPVAGAFVSIPPSRVLDSRVGNGFSGAVPAYGTVALQVAGRGGVPATGVAAVVLNTTVVTPTAPGYVTVFPSGTAQPLASNVNFLPGQTVPNLVTVQVGPDGKVNLYNGSAGPLHLVADVAGYYLSAPIPAPTISTVTPAAGYVTGGTEVTITGTNLTNVTSVTFSYIAGTIVTRVSDTQLTVASPAHAAGAVDARVTSRGGTATSAGSFTYQELANTAVAAWGDDSSGQLRVPTALTGVVAISAGAYFSLALKNDGTVEGWGDNRVGKRRHHTV